MGDRIGLIRVAPDLFDLGRVSRRLVGRVFYHAGLHVGPRHTVNHLEHSNRSVGDGVPVFIP